MQSHPTPTLAPSSPSTGASIAELRAELRAQARRTAERGQVVMAVSTTVQAVRAYWSCVASPGLSLRDLPLDLRPLPESPGATASRQLGELAAVLPAAEAAYQLGLLYSGLLPPRWRARYGVYYTPPALANRLLDQAEAAGLDWKTAQVLDPAAGGGAFLVPAAERLLQSLAGCEPAVAVQNLSARIRGYELDTFAAWLGEVFIDATALRVIAAAGRRPSTLIAVRDSLAARKNGSAYDLVIGNPPFGRITLPEADRKRYERSLYGHANLYGLFFDLAVQLARPGGLVSFLTPSSFLAGEYFKNLRALLWREAPPLALDFVTPRKAVFEDVLQETVLATYHKQGRRASAAVSFLDPQPGSPATPEPTGQFTLPRRASAPWILPRHDDEAQLARRLRAMSHRLADWGYSVSTGPLVWNRHKPQLRDRPGRGSVPLIWAESVTNDGRFVFRSERRNHRPYFRLEDGDDWLVVRRPCVLLQRTTAKEQARRLIAAELPAAFLRAHGGGVTIENHLNMLIPAFAPPAIAPALLAAFLNTAVADRAFRCISGSVAVSAYELENLPLPSPSGFKALLGRHTDASSLERAVSALYLGAA